MSLSISQPNTDLTFSETESARFGLRVFRLSTERIDPKILQRRILEESADVVILRLPVEQQLSLSLLDRLGFPYLVADTLVYYASNLERYQPTDLSNSGLRFVEAGPAHQDVLDALVREIFSGYRNHYSANPLLSADLVAGYQEWVRGYALSKDGSKRAFVVYRHDEPIAFATCALHDGTVAEGVLYGVLPSAKGGGVYGDLIRYTQTYFKSLGCVEFKVSTQINNYAVQKVWAREGFSLSASLLTIHINPLLSHSVAEPRTISLSVTDADIARYAEVTGDNNAIHFDDSVAQNAGFRERIAHGLISNGVVSRFFGTVFPGNGTIFLGYTYRFLAPVYLNQQYSVRFSFPTINNGKGLFRSVVVIRDDHNIPCLIAYCDLARRASVRIDQVGNGS